MASRTLARVSAVKVKDRVSPNPSPNPNPNPNPNHQLIVSPLRSPRVASALSRRQIRVRFMTMVRVKDSDLICLSE